MCKSADEIYLLECSCQWCVSVRPNDGSHNLLHDETSRMTGGGEFQRYSATMQLQ